MARAIAFNINGVKIPWIDYPGPPIALNVAGECVTNAVPGDPCRCAVALQIKRALSSPAVWVEGTRMYALLKPMRANQKGYRIPGHPGEWILYRLEMNQSGRRLVAAVDDPKQQPSGALIQLKRVRKSELRGNKATKNLRFREGKGAKNRGGRPYKNGRAKQIATMMVEL